MLEETGRLWLYTSYFTLFLSTGPPGLGVTKCQPGSDSSGFWGVTGWWSLTHICCTSLLCFLLS